MEWLILHGAEEESEGAPQREKTEVKDGRCGERGVGGGGDTHAHAQLSSFQFWFCTQEICEILLS